MLIPRVATLLACLSFVWFASFAKSEILINFQQAQSDGASAHSVCQCAFTDANAMLHWHCEPFTHSVSTESRSDVTLTAVVTGGAGNVNVIPLSASDQTHYSSGDESADIVMTMDGTGTVEVLINAAIETDTSVAGNHHTTVFLTVTGN